MTYTLAELADMFAVEPRVFSNKLPKLYKTGFPKKLPGSKIWSAPQVDLWIATNGNLERLPDGLSEADYLKNASANLDLAYGGTS